MVTVNFSSEVYEVNEGAGFVRVCLLKDIESDEDLLIHFEASELDSAEAIGMHHSIMIVPCCVGGSKVPYCILPVQYMPYCMLPVQYINQSL